MVPFSPWIQPMGNEGYCGATDATLSVTKCLSLEVTVDLIDCWLLNECHSECQSKALEKNRVTFEVGRVSLSVYSYLENTQVRLCPTERTRDVETNKQTHTHTHTHTHTQEKKLNSSLRCTCKGAELPRTTFQKGSKSWPPEAFVPPAAWGRRTGGRAACRTPPTGGEKESTQLRRPPVRRTREGSPNTPQSARGPTDMLPLGTSSSLPHTPSSQKKKKKKKKNPTSFKKFLLFGGPATHQKKIL